MRFLVILSLWCVGINAISKEFVEKLVSEMHAVGVECVKQEGANEDDIKDLMAHKLPPSTHEGKCVIACFYEHYKMLTPAGTFDKQATADAFISVKSEDEEVYGKVLKVIDICQENPQIFDDRCETATAMAVCVKRETEALGIDTDSSIRLYLMQA